MKPMDEEVSYCRLLEINPDYLVDIIYDLNIDGPISQDYIRPIAESIVEDVAQDIYETADREEWNSDDVRLAVGRVLCKKLNIEI
jgi:hypothetical protein